MCKGKLASAIADMYDVDWSETDGSDVRKILRSHGLKKGSVTKEELGSVPGPNIFMRDTIGECLGLGKNVFSSGK